MTTPTESYVIELDLPARVDLVAVARMVIVAAASCGEVLEGERLDDLQLLTSEAATNAVEANLATEHPGRVCIEAQLGFEGLTLSVSDQGPGLPAFANERRQWHELPDLQAPEGLLRDGGFGLPLMHLLSSQPVILLSSDQGTTVKLHLAP
ncbi:MAG: ATP-binding protein [Actinomycetota bacterium]|nr:ATP-binding protein [Actinomycetota bacterium]